MKVTTCPFLGLRNDPKTAMGFPSDGNFCHRSKPSQSISRDHQREYCLSKNHLACPIFTQVKKPGTLGTIIITLLQRENLKIFFYSAAGLLAFLVIGSIILNWHRITQTLFPLPPDQIQPTEIIPLQGGVSAPNPGSPAAPRLEVSSTPLSLPLIGNNLTTPTQYSCLQPAGWRTYTVKPTDSIYRISLIFGISLEELLKINCLGEDPIIRPGQVIFVPSLPTDTPVPTSTATPQPTPSVVITFPPRPKPTRKEEEPTSTPRPQPVPTSTSEPTQEPSPEPTKPPPPPPEPTKIPTPTSAPNPTSPNPPPAQTPTNVPTSAP